MKNAPRVISRVGSMQNLVDHVLQPTVGNYFRNSAQQVTVLEFLSARSDRQREAFENIRKAIEAYDVECIDTLIGDIVPPAELMKTQTDRKIAAELERTYDAQREAQVKRQALERETAVANLQNDVVRSEQMVRIAQQNALAVAESAKGEANATRARAEGAGAPPCGSPARARRPRFARSARRRPTRTVRASTPSARAATRRCSWRRFSARTTSSSCRTSPSAATAPAARAVWRPRWSQDCSPRRRRRSQVTGRSGGRTPGLSNGPAELIYGDDEPPVRRHIGGDPPYRA